MSALLVQLDGDEQRLLHSVAGYGFASTKVVYTRCGREGVAAAWVGGGSIGASCYCAGCFGSADLIEPERSEGSYVARPELRLVEPPVAHAGNMPARSELSVVPWSGSAVQLRLDEGARRGGRRLYAVPRTE